MRAAELKKELTLNRRELSSSIRKKTSAKDDRPSAKTLGSLGVISLSLVIGFIIFLDITRLIDCVKRIHNYMKTTPNE